MCGCPKDEAGNQGTAITKDYQTYCCLNYEQWNSYFQKYQNGHIFCGCPYGQEVISDDKCCDIAKVIEEGTNKTCCENEVANEIYGGKKICCASGEVVIENEDRTGEVCCANVTMTDDGTQKCCEKETSDESRLCPCESGEVKVSYYKAIEKNYKCCPADKQYLTERYAECCTEDKKYKETFPAGLYVPQNESKFWLTGKYLQSSGYGEHCCSNGTLIDYQTIDTLSKEKQTVKMCCDSVPSCDPQKGVIYQDDSGKCQCGCMNNYDCNLNWKEGDIVHFCQDDHTCASGLSFDISGTRVEVRDFAGGKLTREKVENLVKKVRQDLLASTGNDKVKVIFTGKNTGSIDDALGYSIRGDKLNVYIKSGACKEEGGELLCSAVIIHENVHRVDNVVQPMWGVARKEVTDLYQSILTEIHAQATGALHQVRTALESCYRYKDGQILSTCAPLKDFDPKDCQKCVEDYMAFEWGNDFAEKYVNYNDAKKYYTDSDWAQDNNCNGLQAQLEEDFANSIYAETRYYERKRNQCNQMRLAVSSGVRNAISQFKEASFKDIGLFGMASRLGFKWNSNPSPALVSDIAKLYSEHATLCMSPERFVNHPKIKLGFESEMDINEFEEAYDFVQKNPECTAILAFENGVGDGCQEKLDCLTNLWRAGCWPVAEWASHIGEIETYTID